MMKYENRKTITNGENARMNIEKIQDKELRDTLAKMINRIPTMSNNDVEYEIEWYTEQMEQTDKDTDLYKGYRIYIDELEKYIEVDTKAQKRADTKVDNTASLEENEVEEAEEKDDKIDFEQDMFCPTHEDIRNNYVIEQGRARQRNQNDIYKNLTVGLACGKVGNMETCGEYNKILYDKDIDRQLEQLKAKGITKLPSKTRLTKDLTFISKQLGAEFVEIVNTRENGLCYKIKQSCEGGKYFTSVPMYKWKELVNFTNKEVLRLYLVISMHKDISTEKSVLMTLEYLCMCMGIEPNEGNKKYISTCVNGLFKLGMIDIEQEDRIVFEDGQRKNKTYNFYRLTTKEEYEAKGKKKKRRRKL